MDLSSLYRDDLGVVDDLEDVRWFVKTAEGEWGEDFAVEDCFREEITKDVIEGGRRLSRIFTAIHMARKNFDLDRAVRPKLGDKWQDGDGDYYVVVEKVEILDHGWRYRATCERAK